MRTMRRKRSRENRRECRNRPIHESGESRLYHLEQKCPVYVFLFHSVFILVLCRYGHWHSNAILSDSFCKAIVSSRMSSEIRTIRIRCRYHFVHRGSISRRLVELSAHTICG